MNNIPHIQPKTFFYVVRCMVVRGQSCVQQDAIFKKKQTALDKLARLHSEWSEGGGLIVLEHDGGSNSFFASEVVTVSFMEIEEQNAQRLGH